MAEYIQTYELPASGTINIPLPNGTVRGVYSESAANLSWIENGKEGVMRKAVVAWEPIGGFTPRPSSILKIENVTAVAGQVTLRLEI